MPPNDSPAPRNPPTAAAGPRLRQIPAGYDITRWPIYVPIAHGESLQGWLRTLSRRYGMTPSQTIHALREGSRRSTPWTSLESICLHEPQVPARTGVLQADLEASAHAARQLESWYTAAHEYLHLPQRLALDRGPSRYCPTCLLDSNGIWKAEWFDPLQYVCFDHAAMLRTQCPRCGQAPFSGSGWMRSTPHPLQCPQQQLTDHAYRHHYDPCPQDLTEVAAVPAPRELLDATALLWRWTAEDAPPTLTVAGIEATQTQALTAFMALVMEARLLTPEHRASDEHDHQVRINALQIAARVLSCSTPTQAAATAESWGLMSPHGPVCPIAPATRCRQRPVSALLEAIRIKSLTPHLPTTTALAYRAHDPFPRLPRPLRHRDTRNFLIPDDRPPLRLADVPTCLWSPTAAALGAHTTTERLALTIALAHLGNLTTTAAVLEELGVPARFLRPVTAAWTRLDRRGAWPALHVALSELQASLTETRPPIDYARRRAYLSKPGRLDYATRKAGLRYTPDQRLWLWGLLTGSDPALAPDAWTAKIPDPVTPEPLPADELDLLWNHLRQAWNMPEPLTWTPP